MQMLFDRFLRAFLSFFPALGLVLFFLGGKPARADVTSEMRVLSDSFVSPDYTSTKQTNFQFLGANFTTEPHSEDRLRVDLNAGYAVGAPLMSYFNVKELSFRVDTDQNQSFTFGRHRYRWSELDRRFAFGLVEPVFKWNPLAPESQGLTGFFWDVKGQDVSFGLFGSFLYIPDQGPSFELDSNGQFVPGNPWFQQPPASIKIFQQSSKIEYHYERPNEASVVMQTSYGAHVQLGESSPWKARLGTLYKPMNQLALGYNGVLDISKDRGSAEIQPQVVFHNVTTGDFFYELKRVRAGISTAYDRPSKNVPFDDSWTRPVYSDATLISPFLDVLVDRGLTLTFQRLDVRGGQITETGPLASPNRASITSRYPFQEANQIALDINQRWSGKKRVNMKTSYMQSVKNEFNLFRFEGRMELSTAWSLRSELQLVKAEEITKDNRNDIAAFDNNDRVQVGVGYVF